MVYSRHLTSTCNVTIDGLLLRRPVRVWAHASCVLFHGLWLLSLFVVFIVYVFVCGHMPLSVLAAVRSKGPPLYTCRFRLAVAGRDSRRALRVKRTQNQPMSTDLAALQRGSEMLLFAVDAKQTFDDDLHEAPGYSSVLCPRDKEIAASFDTRRQEYTDADTHNYHDRYDPMSTAARRKQS